MDIIYIRDLRVETRIGIYDWEREIRQRVSLDLDLGITRITDDDDITSTLNYKTLCKRLEQYIEASQCLLIETLAEQLAALVLKEFEVHWLRLRLSKPGAVRNTTDVGVEIERGEKPCPGPS